LPFTFFKKKYRHAKEEEEEELYEWKLKCFTIQKYYLPEIL
jgi:hypothetical protein